jgi:hypothetical protein
MNQTFPRSCGAKLGSKARCVVVVGLHGHLEPSRVAGLDPQPIAGGCRSAHQPGGHGKRGDRRRRWRLARVQHGFGGDIGPTAIPELHRICEHAAIPQDTRETSRTRAADHSTVDGLHRASDTPTSGLIAFRPAKPSPEAGLRGANRGYPRIESIRLLATCSSSSRALMKVETSVSTLCPSRRAVSPRGMPARSHVVAAACRQS